MAWAVTAIYRVRTGEDEVRTLGPYFREFPTREEAEREYKALVGKLQAAGFSHVQGHGPLGVTLTSKTGGVVEVGMLEV